MGWDEISLVQNLCSKGRNHACTESRRRNSRTRHLARDGILIIQHTMKYTKSVQFIISKSKELGDGTVIIIQVEIQVEGDSKGFLGANVTVLCMLRAIWRIRSSARSSSRWNAKAMCQHGVRRSIIRNPGRCRSEKEL